MKKPTSKTVPFSLRLTFDERAKLEEMAGDKPLGVFVRAKLFSGTKLGDKLQIQENRNAQAQILGMLGQSELTKNVHDLAAAAQSGSLDVSPETERLLLDAFEQLVCMKELLLKGMGVRSGKDK